MSDIEWPPLGSEWIWEKDKPSARSRVRVEAISISDGEKWVHARIVSKDAVCYSQVGGLWGNELDRWSEAATPAPPGRLDWETDGA